MNTHPIPTHVIIPEGVTIRVIDNYAGDHDAEVIPGRYALTPEYKIERAEWTASGKDERRFKGAHATLQISEPERTVATVLWGGRPLATKIEPAHTAQRTITIEAWHLSDLARFFPRYSFEFAAEVAA